MKYAIYILGFLGLLGCNSGGSGGGSTTNLAGYETIDAGGGVTIALKRTSDGIVTERGYLVNGVRSGTWMTYYTGEHRKKIKTLASYSNGALNGPYLEMSNRGQINTKVDYKNNLYHGKVTNYKFGRPTEVKTYIENKLDGPSVEYYSKGTPKKETQYKDGMEHGDMRWYNEEGDVTMQYTYEKGKQISGGMIDKKEQ